MRQSSALLFAGLLCIPTLAGAQTPDATVTVCGRTLRAQRGQDGASTLVGASSPVLLGPGAVSFESVSLPGGAAVVVVRAVDGDAPTGGAIVTCAAGAAPTVLWQGSLRWAGEDVGDRVRDEVLVRDIDGDGRNDVVLGRRRESLRLCAVGTVLTDTRRVDAAGRSLVPVAVDPVRDAVRAISETARVEAVTPTAVTFVPRAVVASVGEGRALFDRDPATVWSAPTGGFVTATLPSSALVLRGLEFTPPVRVVGAAHVTVLVEPGPRRFEFDLPPTGLTSGQAWRVALPTNAPARCVSLVTRGALAGMTLRTTLDDGAVTLTALAQAADGPDGEDAARLLVELGPAGASALASALPQMSTVGARRALRLLGTSRVGSVLEAAVAVLDRSDVTEQAADLLRRSGEAALPALSAVVTQRPRAAVVIGASNAPVIARLRALLPAFEEDGDTWAAARDAARALLTDAAAAGGGGAWLAVLPTAPLARARALRLAAEAFVRDAALRAQIADRARSAWTDTDALEGQDRFSMRYRLLPALASDAEGARLVAAVLAGDDDHDLRAEAARALARDGGATAVLVAALRDRAPRVRAAAVTALAGRGDASAALIEVLTHDGWPTVRAAAATALARDGGAVEALLAQLDGPSVLAARAALGALAENPGVGVGPRLVAFIEGTRRNPELRRDALDALGMRCDRSVANDLERIAASQSDPALPPWEQEVGHAALAALARLDPERARALLLRSEANAEARASVERAARSRCE